MFFFLLFNTKERKLVDDFKTLLYVKNYLWMRTGKNIVMSFYNEKQMYRRNTIFFFFLIIILWVFIIFQLTQPRWNYKENQLLYLKLMFISNIMIYLNWRFNFLWFDSYVYAFNSGFIIFMKNKFKLKSVHF